MNAHLRKGVALVATVITAFALALTAYPAHAFDDEPTLMQGSPTSMGQTNGPVWATKIAGGKIFAGGGFTSTRPSGSSAGSNETGQAYLAAFDAATGAPIQGFDPVLTNTWSSSPPIVRSLALSPDGNTLYVGGDFNQINGKRAEHIAAFNTSTGEFIGQVGWNGVDGLVNALAVSNDGQTLYAGGAFSRANWSRRNNLAAFDLTTGDLKPWSPVISSPVTNEALRVVALAVSADDSKVFLAGPFRQVNGASMQGFGATNAETGNNVPGFSSSYLLAPYNWGTSLAVQGEQVYLGARDDLTTTSARREGVSSINTTTGSRTWYANCYGDTFAVQPLGNDVYVGSHAHDCYPAGGMPNTVPTTYLAMHALNRTTGVVKPYFVQTNGTTGNQDSLLLSRTIATDGNQIVMGGGYNSVNGKAQANLSRFASGSSAPDRAAWPSGRSCSGCAYTNLTILEGADRDDISLKYEVFRDWSTTNPIATFTRDSFPYATESFTFRDTGVSIGQQVYYRVRVTDPAGNEVWSVRTPTMTVGTSETSLAAPTSSQRVAAATPSTEPATSAQRAAEIAAAEEGLKANGTRGKKTPKVRTPKPVMDDASVPTRRPVQSRR